MNAEQIKALVRDVLEEVFNKHDLASAERYYVEDYIQHNPKVAQGRAGFQEFFGALFAAFPDWRGTLEHIVVEGDRAFCMIRWGGTHRGTFQGIRATERRVELVTADLFRIAGGKIVEHWDVVADTDMLAALGAITFAAPPPH